MVATHALTQPRSRFELSWVVSTAVPVILFGFFAIAHVRLWLDEGRLTGLGFAIQETLLVVLFVCRRRPREQSSSAYHWIVAAAGTYAVFLLRPHGSEVLGLGGFYSALQVAGFLLSAYCALNLGRSFGIVAANRGIKTSGPYRLVRHPIYISYLLGQTGYVLAAFSLANLLVLAIALAFQVQRIFAEESVLLRDEDYRRYAATTRFRLVPGVF